MLTLCRVDYTDPLGFCIKARKKTPIPLYSFHSTEFHLDGNNADEDVLIVYHKMPYATYSDGTSITVDYNKGEYVVSKA